MFFWNVYLCFYCSLGPSSKVNFWGIVVGVCRMPFLSADNSLRALKTFLLNKKNDVTLIAEAEQLLTHAKNLL